jgi:hypothetical protein
MVLKIAEKFSQNRSLIEKYYKDDETFKEIYDDYLTYLQAFQFWAQSSSDDALVRRSEYEKLVSELEDELTDILVSKDPDIGPGIDPSRRDDRDGND